MYKYLSKSIVLLMTVTASSFYLLPTKAEAKCVNFWVNPTTGKEECLNIQVNKQPVVEDRKTTATPAGFEFLTTAEQGANLFIKVSENQILNGVLTSFPTVVTQTNNGRNYNTKYRVNCHQRSVYIYSDSNAKFNNSLVVSDPGTLGYMIWNRSCQNNQTSVFNTDNTNQRKLRVVPTICGDYKLRIVDQDDNKPRQLNPYWLGRDGYLSGFYSRRGTGNRDFKHRQKFDENNQNYQPVKPQFESEFQNNYQRSGGYRLRGC
jgi:hypothetical protein